MSASRLAISLSSELDAEIRDAASEEGIPVSRWLADAAAQRLRHKRLGQLLDAYEAEFGSFTDEELAKVDRKWPVSS